MSWPDCSNLEAETRKITKLNGKLQVFLRSTHFVDLATVLEALRAQNHNKVILKEEVKLQFGISTFLALPYRRKDFYANFEPKVVKVILMVAYLRIMKCL